MSMSRHLLALAAAAAAFTLPAQAVTFAGDTTGGPLWDRPFESFSGLSAFGTGVHYEVTPFTVTADGVYTFQNTAVGGWDNFSFVYAGSFDPAAPLANGVVGNDDNPGIGLSGFAPALTAGTSYFYVVTGFEATEFGAYNAEITGPGDVILGAVPEPGSYGLMGLGLAAVLLGARHRRREREAA